MQPSHVNWEQGHKLSNQYQIYSATKTPTQKITGLTSITKNPTYLQNNQRKINTLHLINTQVQPQKIAMAKHKAWYVQVAHKGKIIGWINRKNLHPVQVYLLPYTYISQFWPSPADDACEIASLKTALSSRNKAMSIPLRRMVESIPRTNNPNKGYTKDPYQYGSHATINPDAMVKIAKQYHANAQDITGASKRQLIYNVTHGLPTVVEGPYMMKKPGSDHDLVIVGYRKGYFKLVDPFARTPINPHSVWTSTNNFMYIFNKPFRKQHALVIK